MKEAVISCVFLLLMVGGGYCGSYRPHGRCVYDDPCYHGTCYDCTIAKCDPHKHKTTSKGIYCHCDSSRYSGLLCDRDEISHSTWGDYDDRTTVESTQADETCDHGESVSSSEELCEKGTYSSLGYSPCDDCPIGKYGPREGMCKCLNCPGDKTTVATGSKSISACKSRCEPGQYSSTGLEACSQCDIGSYQPERGQTECIPCDPGWSTLASGSTSVEDCIEYCPPGQFSDTGLKDCSECATGSYQQNSGQTECIPCADGQSTTGPGRMYPEDCIDVCPPGFYSNTGLSPCIACAVGYYQDESQSESCEPCPDGTSTLSVGTTSVEDCIALCSPGEYSNTGMVACSPCAWGYYEANYGSTECEMCPCGTSTVGEGSTSSTDCLDICPPGQFSATGLAVCEDCPYGQYQDLPGQTSCSNCYAQQSTVNTGSTSQDDCLGVCPPGSSSSTGLEPCDLCDVYSYQDESQSTSCKSCPTAFETYAAGATSEDQCFAWCGKGHYSANGLEPCQPCEVGSYQPDYRQTSCIKCDCGYSTKNDGSILETSCKALCASGTSSSDGMEPCTPCPQDTYQPSIGQTSCEPCPADTFTTDTGNSCVDECHPECQPGSYSSNGLVPCNLCEIGTYEPNPGSTSCTSCSSVQTTLAEGSQTEEDCKDLCVPGTSSPSGINLSNCLACGIGYYQPDYGATSCIKCDLGCTTDNVGSTQASDCYDVLSPHLDRKNRTMGYFANIAKYRLNRLLEIITQPCPSIDRSWIPVFRGYKGIDTSIYNAWRIGANTGYYNPMQCADPTVYPAHFRTDYNPGSLGVRRAKVELFKDNQRVAFIQFYFPPGSTVTRMNWFDKQYLEDSSWTDLVPTDNYNYFSIDGDGDRKFFINRAYPGCPNDFGWLLVLDGGGKPCGFDKQTSYPTFLYSPKTTGALWETEYAEADVMLISLSTN